MSEVDGIHGAVAPDNGDWRRSGTALVEAIPIPDSGSDEGGTLEGVRDAAHAAGPDVRVGGQPAANDDFIDAVYGSFPLMIALITVTTFILLARVLPPAAPEGDPAQHPERRRGLGRPGPGLAARVRLRLIWGIEATGSIPSWMPLMIFAFLFGLSMDYEVFILARMREEYDRTGRPHRGGPGHRAHRAAGHQRRADPVPRLRFDGLSPGTDLKMFATGLGAGILLDATVIGR